MHANIYASIALRRQACKGARQYCAMDIQNDKYYSLVYGKSLGNC